MRSARLVPLLALPLLFTAALAADPETVMITYRPSPGNEAKLQQVIADHWAAATRLVTFKAREQAPAHPPGRRPGARNSPCAARPP